MIFVTFNKLKGIKTSISFQDYKQIPLFYWSEIKFIFRNRENYGDLLSKYLVEKISGKTVKFVQPKKQAWYKSDKTNLLAIGSILPHASKHSIVWGSGIIDKEHAVANADFRAVRGPKTRTFLQEMGYECPPVYGDPALLLPNYYVPKVSKKYKIGVIPHYHDYQKALELFENDQNIKVIDLLCLDVETVTDEIWACERTISSSLHGLIVSQTYGTPSIWVEFSDKIFGDGIKYPDYLESVDLPVYQPPFIEKKMELPEIQDLFKDYPHSISEEKLKKVQQELMRACPL